MHTETEKLAGQIRRVINKLIFLEKRTVLRHGSLKLYPSEIHLLQVISREPDLNGGQMAKRLGITNGAVSQTLTRLEKKGVITKAKDPSLKNEMTAGFTELGREAIQRFEEERASAKHLFSVYLAGLSDSERTTVEGFLSHMEEFLKGLG